MDFQKPVKIISDLHVKYAEKPWNETIRLVRRCMERSRDASRPNEPLIRCLERLHETLNVNSVNTMMSRLELIAKQIGMGFHFTEPTCYLTADMFYLEVLLLPAGRVEDVKLALCGEAPESNESLLQLLRTKDFVEFSLKVAGLSDLYGLFRDNERKMKLFASLRLLWKDLQKISHLPRALKESDPLVDTILNGRIGYLMAGKGDVPVTILFYISPSDILKNPKSKMKAVCQAAQVLVGRTDANQQLQMASVMPQPPVLDPQGDPVLLAVSEVLHEALPACFLLQLQPPLPLFFSFVNRLRQITAVDVPAVQLQGSPFPKILMRGLSRSKTCAETLEDVQDAIFKVRLPGGAAHSYVLPGGAWERADLRGTAVDSVPFTHPGHVAALLDVLRHQCAVNTLLTSVMTSHWDGSDEVGDLHFEVLPESDTCFSVTFYQPDFDSLVVLLVNVDDCHHLTCSVFAAGLQDASVNHYISTVMTRCMSIPLTMRALCGKLEEIATRRPPPPPPPPPPVSPPVDPEVEVEHPADPEVEVEHPADPEVEVEHPADPEVEVEHPVNPEVEVEHPAAPSPAVSHTIGSAVVTEFCDNTSEAAADSPAAFSDSPYYFMSVTTSQPVVEPMNTSLPVNPYTCVPLPAGVHSHWGPQWLWR